MTLPDLARLFVREAKRWARYPRARHAALVIVRKPHNVPRRSMAFARTGKAPLIGLYPEALSLPRANIVGLLRHEFGHLAAPRASEQGADDLAARVGGRLIKYDRRLIQTVGRGCYPRPLNIHR